jgi:hypothetical protein
VARAHGPANLAVLLRGVAPVGFRNRVPPGGKKVYAGASRRTLHGWVAPEGAR